jgi:hypothetical protein
VTVRVGLASDAFGNAALLARALAVLEEAGAERVFFLGGSWGDVDAALALDPASAARRGPRVVRVASRACAELAAGAPLRVLELVNGAVCCLVHARSDLSRDDIANATFLIHGKADGPSLTRIGPRYFITPGHLCADAPPDRPPTFALLRVEASEVELVVFDEDGRERQRLSEGVEARAAVKVR